MQRIIKDRQVVDDRWHLLPKDATLESVPNSDDVIIPLALWLEHGPALRGRDGGLGV
ncbi:oxidoreductase, partial [Chryseobacterium phosphatilyticum]